tara:strand:+ start:947 stop:1975 length:1029 start_codon:yes stop_codon:yes gene_type:complete
MAKRIQIGFIIILASAFLVVQLLSSILSVLITYKNPIMTIALSCLAILCAYRIFSGIYFRSNKFIHLKESLSAHTNNCNELNHYIEELKGSYTNIESYNYGTAELADNSVYSFKRKEWNKAVQSKQIHHCSATVCKNASSQPIKYLCKYFDINIDELSLSKFEKIYNDFTSVDQGKVLLIKERDSILEKIYSSIPFLIHQFSKEKLIRKLGFEKVDISDTHIPTFSFQYISAGGNSSSKCDINLNIENLDLLINYLNDQIKWTKSIAGQRSLMTAQLRNKIKERDNFKCCSCRIGIADETNLLLEIDHKIPLSKGGMTTYDNLQTLCWKCNRTKGAKILNYA